jgi:hypothetical protein
MGNNDYAASPECAILTVCPFNGTGTPDNLFSFPGFPVEIACSYDPGVRKRRMSYRQSVTYDIYYYLHVKAHLFASPRIDYPY